MPEREPSKEAMALAESILVEVQVGHELWRKPGIATALDAFAQQARDEALDFTPQQIEAARLAIMDEGGFYVISKSAALVTAVIRALKSKPADKETT